METFQVEGYRERWSACACEYAATSSLKIGAVGVLLAYLPNFVALWNSLLVLDQNPGAQRRNEGRNMAGVCRNRVYLDAMDAEGNITIHPDLVSAAWRWRLFEPCPTSTSTKSCILTP